MSTPESSRESDGQNPAKPDGAQISDQGWVESLLAAERRTLEMIAGGACLTDILKDLCHTIDARFPAVMSMVLLADLDGKRLWPAAWARELGDWAHAIPPLPIGPDTGSCGTAASLKRPVITPDIAGDPLWSRPPAAHYREVALRHGLRASWSQPLISKNLEVLGTFAIYHTEPRSPSPGDLEWIEGAANIAVIAIESDRSRTALERAFEEAKDSEVKLWQVIDTIPTLAWCNLPDGPNEFLNKRWHEYTGLSPEESHGWGWQSAFHPEDLPPLMERWREMLVSGEPGEIEARLRRHDGVFRWFLIRAEPLRDKTGKIIRWYGTSTDIEDRKQAEEKLRQDEMELREITDVIAQAIWVLAPDGSSIYANQWLLDFSGLTMEDVMAADFRTRFFHPEDVERLRDERRQALSKGVPFENEQRARRKDGQYRWHLIRYNPLRDEQGQVIRWYATGTDIEERKQAEERTRNENLALREEIRQQHNFEEIIGNSAALKKVLGQVETVAPTDSTVLILGETGTGKELIARAIHSLSARRERTLVKLNCAAIPTGLLESELFGHEKGAFTGAISQRLGRFELSHKGTLFLDEVGGIPLDLQPKLLRVLQEQEFERLGSARTHKVDVRLIAATNADLGQLVADKKFRPDLYYRLNVFPVIIPPLRDRREDIPPLARWFTQKYASRMRKPIRSIPASTLSALAEYHWPGNVRELENLIERAVILSSGPELQVPLPELRSPVFAVTTGAAVQNLNLEDAERAHLLRVLDETNWIISGRRGAAEILGLNRSTLRSKMKKLGIKRPS